MDIMGVTHPSILGKVPPPNLYLTLSNQNCHTETDHWATSLLAMAKNNISEKGGRTALHQVPGQLYNAQHGRGQFFPDTTGDDLR